MARLNLSLPLTLGGDSEMVVGGSLLDGDLETISEFSLEAGRTKDFDLDEGNYTVQVTLPSGTSITRSVSLDSGDSKNVMLRPPEDSPHEWLMWSTLTGNTPTRNHYPNRWDELGRLKEAKARQEAKTVRKTTVRRTREADADDTMSFLSLGNGLLDDLEDESEPPHEAETPLPSFLTPYDGVWHRFFIFDGQAWQSIDQPWFNLQLVTDGVSWKYSMFFDGNEQLAIQTGGLNIPWRFTLIPSGEAEILIQRGEEQSERERGIKLSVDSKDFRSQTLLGYLMRGDYVSLRMVGEGFIDQAEQMLYSKLRDPMGAAVGGYFLLVSENYERLHNWPNNFANWIDWLPDSAIIHGWQLMKQPDDRDRDFAIDRFLEAVRRGIPLYTVGLRYLYDALDYFSRSLDQNHAQYTMIRGALAKVAAWTQAADWSSAYTTLFGRLPEFPDLLSEQGVPFDWTGMQFLPEIDPEANIETAYLPFPPTPPVSQLMTRPSFVVRPTNDIWTVYQEQFGREIANDTFANKNDAVNEATALAKKYSPSRLVMFDSYETLFHFEIFDDKDRYQDPRFGRGNLTPPKLPERPTRQRREDDGDEANLSHSAV